MNVQRHTTGAADRFFRHGLSALAAGTCVLALAACSAGTSAAGQPTIPSVTASPSASASTDCAPSSGCTPPSSTPSSTVPAGLPADWSAQAIRAAAASFQTCAQATSLLPPNCPQGAGGGDALAVHWTVLNTPLDHAVAVPVQNGGNTSASPQVVVYGHFQMELSYTTAGQALRPYLDYAGGIATATMTWDGHSFQNVQFTSQDTASAPDPGTLPPFTRPADVTDTAVLSSVKSGFAECVTLAVPLTAVGLGIPNCPQGAAVTQVGTVTSANWTIAGDPTQGALVSFDAAHGNFAVTGSYRMDVHYATNNGNKLSGDNGAHTRTSTGNYTAVLAWDGRALKLLKITSS